MVLFLSISRSWLLFWSEFSQLIQLRLFTICESDSLNLNPGYYDHLQGYRDSGFSSLQDSFFIPSSCKYLNSPNIFELAPPYLDNIRNQNCMSFGHKMIARFRSSLCRVKAPPLIPFSVLTPQTSCWVLCGNVGAFKILIYKSRGELSLVVQPQFIVLF